LKDLLKILLEGIEVKHYKSLLTKLNSLPVKKNLNVAPDMQEQLMFSDVVSSIFEF